MTFLVTIFVVYIASKVLRSVIEDLQRRIEEGMPGGKMETKPSDMITGFVAVIAFGIAWQMLDKTVLTFFVVWVGWQLLKSVLESLQGRMREQQSNSQEGRKATFAQGRPHGHQPTEPQVPPGDRGNFATGRPHRHQARQGTQGERPSPLESLGDLERLFTEAMERKMGIEQEPGQARQRVAQPGVRQPGTARHRVAQPRQPEPEPDAWIPAQPEPRREARREVRVERERAARPSRREAAKPAARTRQRKRREPSKKPARPAPVAAIPMIGRLNKSDVRRGIIIAEILGSPKGLRDEIDSNVI